MRTVVAICALAACNQVYDLSDTDVVITDTDDDGVLDIIDVCIDLPNPAQEDTDDDGVGDLCDPCPEGSNHNEDGDSWLDGCDNCPHLHNEDQGDSDADHVGDVCDPAATTQQRIRFESFEALSTEWTPGVTAWRGELDAALPDQAPANDDYGMWNRHIEVSGVPWLIEVQFRLADTNGLTGLLTRNRNGVTEFTCVVSMTTGSWRLYTRDDSVSIPAPTGATRLRVRFDGTAVQCEIPGVAGLPLQPSLATPRTNPGLLVQLTTSRFDYVEAIATP